MLAIEQLQASISPADQQLAARLCSELYSYLEQAIEASPTDIAKRELTFHVLQSVVTLIIASRGEELEKDLQVFCENVKKMLNNINQLIFQSAH